jgi:ElaB/YqjD/DUF883 family membrane-anchored ribosome-binding protein
MASTFSRLRDDMGDDLENQISALRHEVSSLKKTMSKRGAAALEDTRDNASDLYEELMGRVQDAMPHIAKRTREMRHDVRKAAHDNPVAATLVGVAVVGLLLGLVMRR